MSSGCVTPPRPAPPGIPPMRDVPAPRSASSPSATPVTETPGPPTTPHARPHPVEVLTPGPDSQHPQQRRYPRSYSAHRPAPRSAFNASPTPIGETTSPRQAAELLRRAANGDPRAWEEILRCYSSLVIAKVRVFRLQDADAHDAVQNTWLRLAENLHRIQHPERLAGWLATTAARECLRILHHIKRTPPLTDTMADHTTDSAPGPEQRVINAHTTQMLRMLIAELPPRRRRLLRALFTDHPTSYAELSRVTGIPLGSIGPTRNRALHQLRQKLLNHELSPPDSR
jgi:RNA polymerase sigma factor (sigma-70 family)